MITICDDLRASVLQAAIQGKLVPQIESEGTAEELYLKIQAEKECLVKEKKIKKEKPYVPISENEIPFDLPDTWAFKRLGELCTKIVDGDHNPPAGISSASEYMMLSAINIGSTGLQNLDKVRYLKKEDFIETSKRTNLVNGDVLLTIVGTLGRSCVYNESLNVTFQRSVSVITTLLNNKYLKYVFDSPYVQDFMACNSTGTAQQGFYLNQLKDLIIPFPSVAEQKRIVKKLEEILAKIDALENDEQKLVTLYKEFSGDMKASFLQAAIQGRLVPQIKTEGTSDELYMEIQKEKERLVKEKKIKKEKSYAPVTDDEIPFDIPETWRWVRLGDCTSYSQIKVKITASDIQPNMWSLDLEDIEKDSGKIIKKNKASNRTIKGDKVKFTKGQVLYSKLRPYLKKVLVAPEDGICSSEMVPFMGYANINAQYLVYVLTSPHVDTVINAATYGVKMPRVGTETMINLLIPLPPILEQNRIVAKLEELLPLCDKFTRTIG